MIKKIKIENFKCIKGIFELELNKGVNVIVGNNEVGKSTILEAIHLALTGIFRGKFIRGNLSQYIFNYDIVKAYLESVNNGNAIAPPHILIELYMNENIPILEGDKFTDKKAEGKTSGIALKIALDEKYNEEYESVIKNRELSSLPIEYYDVDWYAFSRKPISTRSVPLKSSFIDVGFSKFKNGSDIYISRIIQDLLETQEKIKVSQAYRKLKDNFAKDISISDINSKITNISNLSDKKIELAVDLSSSSTWEGSLITQLNKIPFDFIGKGEQSIIKIELALSSKKSEASSVILIEEPESHVSYSRLNNLLKNIRTHYDNKQILISTHSSFVANKLGLDNLILLNRQKAICFKKLESQDFFKKVAGYDTLRLILSEKAILCEGASDELIIQRAYMDFHNGRLPIEDNIDVISVGTSFLRFIEIAEKLNIEIKVITDNDGDIEALEKKYTNYVLSNKKKNIEICYDSTIYEGNLTIGKNKKPFNYNTLEPSLLRENSLGVFNKIFDKKFENDDDMHKYMKSMKTECAIKIFEYEGNIKYPDYILRAIS